MLSFIVAANPAFAKSDCFDLFKQAIQRSTLVYHNIRTQRGIPIVKRIVFNRVNPMFSADANCDT